MEVEETVVEVKAAARSAEHGEKVVEKLEAGMGVSVEVEERVMERKEAVG